MPTTNKRGHKIPLGTETTITRSTIFEAWGNSIRDVVPVANVPARAQLVADLTGVGEGPSSAKPLYVYRHDAPGLHRIEWTVDGTVWIPFDGRLRFADLAAGTAWATANAAYLTVGDEMIDAAGVVYRWSGSAWLQAITGLQLLRKATFTAATSLSIDGVMTSLYDAHKVLVDVASATSDAGATMQLRAGGSALSSAYVHTFLEMAVGIGPTRQEGTGQTAWQIGRYASGGGSIEVDVFNGPQARAKRIKTRSYDQTSYNREGGGYHSSTTAHDGIGLQFPTAATGTVRVYGYANG